MKLEEGNEQALDIFTDNFFFEYDVIAKDSGIDEVLATKNAGHEEVDSFLRSLETEQHEEEEDPQQQQEQILAFVQEQMKLQESTVAKNEEHAMESKKRRNLAASARFRNKKKAKLQEMETEMNRLNMVILEYNNQLKKAEIENRILKNLLLKDDKDVIPRTESESQ